ncbi:MAG: hypothetical protein WCC36_14455 [Gammaproteobacteria bacterium]
MAFTIDLATGQVCEPGTDKHCDESPSTAAGVLQLGLQQATAADSEALPVSLRNQDSQSFIAAMEKF